MTTFLLIRHASHDLLGRTLVGRSGDVPLNAAGRKEAAKLTECLAPCPIRALYCSPQGRTRQTAQVLADGCAEPLIPRIDSAFDEIDFGEWTGLDFPDLAELPGWARWNRGRASARCPGGERMRDVQQRAVNGLERLRRSHPAAVVAVVSHGDVLKAILLHSLGMSLDLIHTLEVGPASVSVLALEEGRSHLRLLNDNGRNVRQVLESNVGQDRKPSDSVEVVCREETRKREAPAGEIRSPLETANTDAGQSIHENQQTAAGCGKTTPQS